MHNFGEGPPQHTHTHPVKKPSREATHVERQARPEAWVRRAARGGQSRGPVPPLSPPCSRREASKAYLCLFMDAPAWHRKA